MAATGLLGINPYQKGVALDISSKPINFAIQAEQRNESKREALDKYFMDYEKSLNPAGMRTQDQDAFLKKLAETKQYYLKNKDKILNPAKYGAEAQSQLMAGYKDVLSTIDKSKQRAAEDKVLAPFIIDARKNNRTIPQDVLDALERNKLSIADPNHVGFDPLSFDAYDKHDPFKYQQGIYSRIKPSESMPERLFDKKNNEITYKTVNDISNKSFGEIQNVVASELQKDRGLIDTVTEIARDQNRLNQLAQVFKDFSGKQMNPNSLQDVATAYTIALKPEAQVKYTDPTTTEDSKFQRQKELARYRKSLGLDGGYDEIDPVADYLDKARTNTPFVGAVGENVEKLSLPTAITNEFKSGKNDSRNVPVIGRGVNDGKYYNIKFQDEIKNGKKTGGKTDLIDWTNTVEIPEVQLRAAVTKTALPSNAKISIVQGRAKTSAPTSAKEVKTKFKNLPTSGKF